MNLIGKYELFFKIYYKKKHPFEGAFLSKLSKRNKN